MDKTKTQYPRQCVKRSLFYCINISLFLLDTCPFQFTMAGERIGGIAVDGQYKCCKKNCKNFLIGDLHKTNM